MGYILAGIVFYFLGWAAGFTAGKNKNAEIAVYLMEDDGYSFFGKGKINWNNALKEANDNKLD